MKHSFHFKGYSELNAFLPAGDDVLSLDAGGEVFRVYRSTLQQAGLMRLAGLLGRGGRIRAVHTGIWTMARWAAHFICLAHAWRHI